MPEFRADTYRGCGKEFGAVPSANAAERELCSPRCERLAAATAAGN